MQNQKGFTIIELIVVIAIIAVLAGIVLVNVTSYINKGKDAAIKGNLTSLITNAAVYFDDSTKGNGDYIGFDADATTGCGATGPIYKAIDAATDAPTCATNVAGDTFCACAKLLQYSTAEYFCVDSTGAKVQSTTTCATSCTAASPAC